MDSMNNCMCCIIIIKILNSSAFWSEYKYFVDIGSYFKRFIGNNDKTSNVHNV